MVTRLVGTCQICEGEFKLDQSAHMVHHGYKRPGRGYIVGDCAAVGHPAYEQSCELLKSYTRGLHNLLAESRERLRQLEAGEVTTLSETTRPRYNQPEETHTYKVGDREFGRVLHNNISQKTQLCRWLVDDIKRCEARIAAWKLQPIRTLEEAEADKRAVKDVAAAAREAKRQAKLADKIKSYQKRIDSAVRNHTTSTLADIFESAPSKLREIAGYDTLSACGALALLERDHVWAAFALDITRPKPVSGERSQNARICSDMRYPEYHFPTKCYPWPAGL